MHWFSQNYIWLLSGAVLTLLIGLASFWFSKRRNSSITNSPHASGSNIKENVNSPTVHINVPAPVPPEVASMRPNMVRKAVRRAWLLRYGETWGIGSEFDDSGELVTFKNEARTGQQNVGALVRAHLIIQDKDGNEQTSFYGQWCEQASGVADFKVDQTRDLILGLVRADSFCGLENKPMPDAADGFTSRIHFMGLTEGFVAVRLTNADTGDVLYEGRFRFTTAPFAIECVDESQSADVRATNTHATDAQSPESGERYDNSDKLAIALAFVGVAVAIVLFLIAPLLETAKTATVLVLLGLLLGSVIYPVIHFFRSRFRRVHAFVGIAILSTVFGVLLLRPAKHVEAPNDKQPSSSGEQPSKRVVPPPPEAGSAPRKEVDTQRAKSLKKTITGERGSMASLTISRSEKVSTDPDAPYEMQLVIATTRNLPGLNSVMVHCDGNLVAWSWTSPDQNTIKKGVNGNSFQFPYSSLRYGLTPEFDPAHPLVFLVWSKQPVTCGKAETF
jgi:hypothetical protein